MLKQLCEQTLLPKVATETAADLLYLADLYSATKLKTACLDFIRDNLMQVTLTKSWDKVAVLVGQEFRKMDEEKNKKMKK